MGVGAVLSPAPHSVNAILECPRQGREGRQEGLTLTGQATGVASSTVRTPNSEEPCEGFSAIQGKVGAANTMFGGTAPLLR
jgi:hypothetical protein